MENIVSLKRTASEERINIELVSDCSKVNAHRCAKSANVRDEARRAKRVRHATGAESRRRLQHGCWAVSSFCVCCGCGGKRVAPLANSPTMEHGIGNNT